MSPFRSMPHTADLALEIWADSRPGLFREAARGLLALLLDTARPPRAEPEQWRAMELRAPDPAFLLADFLSEILALANLEGQLVMAVDVTKVGQADLSARLGLAPAAALGGVVQEIKAVTYHGVAPGRQGRRWRAVVVCDV